MKTRQITVNAMLIAITALLAIVPNLGIITIGPVSLTIMHIPVILAGIVFGFQSAVITGLTFGISSMFVAMTRGATPVDLLFINPVVSVLPRLLFGISVGLLWNAINRFKINDDVKIGVTAFVSTVVHAVFVLGILYFFLGFTGDMLAQFSQWTLFIWGILLSNTFVEAIAAVILCIPLVRVLRKIKK